MSIKLSAIVVVLHEVNWNKFWFEKQKCIILLKIAKQKWAVHSRPVQSRVGAVSASSPTQTVCGQLAWAGPVFMVRRGGWLDWVARVGLFVFKPVRTASQHVRFGLFARIWFIIHGLNSVFLSYQTNQQYFQPWLISQFSRNEQTVNVCTKKV